MQLDVQYKELGSLPIDLIDLAAELCHEIDWSLDRYTRDNDISLSTYSRLLPMPSLSSNNFEYNDLEKKLVNVCKSILSELPELYADFKILNFEIATLPPDTIIKLHYDSKWSHKSSHRVHIPIITNDDCVNTWINAKCKMNLGKFYEINNRVFHGAANRGTSIRTHLIIDFIDPALYDAEMEAGRKPWRGDGSDLKPLI